MSKEPGPDLAQAGGRPSKAPLVVLGVLVLAIVGLYYYTVRERTAPPQSTQEGAVPPQAVVSRQVTVPESGGIVAELESRAQTVREEQAEEQEAVTSEAGERSALDYVVPAEAFQEPYNPVQQAYDDMVARERTRRSEARYGEYLAALGAETTVIQDEGDPAIPITTAPMPTAAIAQSGYEIAAGTVIGGVLDTSINTHIQGAVIGRVLEDVFDSATGEMLLVPSGSRLVGGTGAPGLGVEKVTLAWHTLVYPSGGSAPLDPPWPASDPSGEPGLTGRIDRHFWRRFGTAVALGGVGAGIQLSQPRTAPGQHQSGQEIAAGEIGRQVGTLGTEYARQGLNMAPTITVARGARFVIVLPMSTRLPTPGGEV